MLENSGAASPWLLSHHDPALNRKQNIGFALGFAALPSRRHTYTSWQVIR
jgi:hypothetical protein